MAALGAVMMALAFPKTNAAVLAPVGATALFWAWFGVSPRRAFWVGWLAGTVFFAITFRWFGETAGALIAPFGFLLALGPAVADGFFGFALPGALVAFAAAPLRRGERLPRALVPLAAAAIFAAAEWLRAEGLGEIAVPFGGLGYTQVASPLAPLAAFVGEYGVTFALCVLAAYAAYAIRLQRVRGTAYDAGIAALAVLAAVAAAWAFWPARTLAAPLYRVAAVQGNVPQSIKFTPGADVLAVRRYAELTRRAAPSRPSLVLWPETVIPAAFNARTDLQARFEALAKTMRTELVVGTLSSDARGDFNVLYFFRPDGSVDAVYRKRQLVPFAEHVPWSPLFLWIPWMRNVSHYGEGNRDGVIAVNGLRLGPIVCWESAFTDLVRGDVHDGADALLVATDDAWFGSTAGPYQHAQIAQMRALETGRWIVRAASTGISGIIAPNGRYTVASRLEEEAVVTGMLGKPVATVYDAIGGTALAAAFAILYAGIVAFGRRVPR